MTKAEMYSEVREMNLSYLMLAQRMIREDRDSALFRLGVADDVADILERLTPGQLLRMASSDMVLCRFRFDDRLMIDLLSSHERETPASRLHAAILAADRPLEAVA